MIIDPIDLKLIRQLELQGSISVDEIVSKFHITREEIFLRIKNFEDSGFITDYGLKLFLPKIAGGRWFWGCAATEATARFKPEKSVPYLEEIVENLSFPIGVCPNVSLIFYTKNLREAYRVINKTPGLRYAEIYKIDEYNVSIPTVLTERDWQLIAQLYLMPKLHYSKINTILYEPKSDAEIKMSRLVWSKKNRKGVILLFPHFNWAIIKNYLHLHLAIITKMRSKELRRLVNKLGYSANITSRFKKRYLQIEFDVWGFSDMQTIIDSLERIGKMTIEGCSFAYKNRIYNEWIEDYIAKKI